MTMQTERVRPQRHQFRCLEPIRVRWSEVDLQKIVFNGHYLNYFDLAVTAYWRQMAMPYHAAMEQLKGDLYVRKATLEYEASARWDDQLEVGMRLRSMGRTSLTLQACAFKGHRPLVHGEMVYVFADPATQTSRPVPEALRQWVEAFEAGAAMVDTHVASWEDAADAAQALRTTVFVEEQGVPMTLERDALDGTARHAVARNRLGQAIGTGRWTAQASPAARPAPARIGRMAVLQGVRGAGVGRSLLQALEADIHQHGISEVTLHAQTPVIGFYRSLGYRAEGEVFEEAGIPHQTMRKSLEGKTSICTD